MKIVKLPRDRVGCSPITSLRQYVIEPCTPAAKAMPDAGPKFYKAGR